MKDNIIKRLFRSKSVDNNLLNSDLIGWHSYGAVDALRYYRDNQYENGYGAIQAITKQFFTSVPYAVNAAGKRQKQTNITDVLGHPNKDMSGLDFREALSIMSLVHDKVYIRVWFKGNKPSESNIFGFTFLENVTETYTEEGSTIYTSMGQTFDDSNVIELKNINPYWLHRGYSTANAVKRWARIDDYVASYQAGFFENGAIPAGQFLISAPTVQEYEDIVRNLKAKHQGTGKNDNVVYDYAPLDPATGKPTTGAITWIPFSTTNKDLALKDIFDQVNEKIDSAYGVPASMRGVNDNNTYASVRIDQEIFIDNAVRPFALKVWTRFTHELNRITGGLGYALVVDIETPHIAEEDLAEAQTQNTQVTALTSLLTSGFTIESAVTALELPESFLALELSPPPETPAVAEDDEQVAEDETAIDEGGEVDDSPTKTIDPLDVHCKHCGRYLFKATGTTVVEDMPCPKCKAKLNFKIINPLGNDVTHTFTYVETDPTDMKMVARSKELSQEQVALMQNKIAQTMRKQMEEQIEKTDVKTKAIGDADEEKIKLYAKELLSIVTPLITSEGMKQYLMARTIDEIANQDLSNFSLTSEQLSKYQVYLQDIVKGYSEDTADAIRKNLDVSIGNNLPSADVKKSLSSIMQTDEWRVQRLALSETNRAGNTGSIYAMEKVAEDTHLTINKIWQTRPNSCEYCQALDGTEVGVTEEFVAQGDTIKGVDGGEITNDFGHMDVPTAHSNCGCYTTYKVVKD